jgi:hypothetical protein
MHTKYKRTTAYFLVEFYVSTPQVYSIVQFIFIHQFLSPSLSEEKHSTESSQLNSNPHMAHHYRSFALICLLNQAHFQTMTTREESRHVKAGCCRGAIWHHTGINNKFS